MMLLPFTQQLVTIKMREDPATIHRRKPTPVPSDAPTPDSTEDDSDVPIKSVRFSSDPRVIENTHDIGAKEALWYSTKDIRRMLLETEIEQHDIAVLAKRSWMRSYAQVLTTIYRQIKSNSSDDVFAVPRVEYDRFVRFLSSEKEHHVFTGLERRIAPNIAGELDRNADSTRQAVMIIQHQFQGHPEHIRQASLRYSRHGQRLATAIGHAHHAIVEDQQRRSMFRFSIDPLICNRV